MPDCNKTFSWVLVAAVWLGMWCAPLGVEAAQRDDELAARIERIVEQLGDPDWPTREQAQAALEELPAASVPMLAQAYRRSDDAEVRMRLERHGKTLFTRYILPHHPNLRRPGFLGIGQQVVQVDGQLRIEVQHVVPDSAADRAQIKPGDRIVSLNGKPVDQTDPVTQFSNQIKDHQPGQKVTLTLYRQGQKMTLTAALGELPVNYLSNEQELELVERRNAFEKHWIRNAYLKGRLEVINTPGGGADR